MGILNPFPNNEASSNDPSEFGDDDNWSEYLKMEEEVGDEAAVSVDFDPLIEADELPSEGAPSEEAKMDTLESEILGAPTTVTTSEAEVEPIFEGSNALSEVLEEDPLFNDMIQRKIDTQLNDTADKRAEDQVRLQAVDQLVRNVDRDEFGGLSTIRRPLRQTGVG